MILKIKYNSIKILYNRTFESWTQFDNIVLLRKKLEEAIKVTEEFGRDARSIKNVLESIKNRGDNDDDDPDPKPPTSSFGIEEDRKVS